MKKFIVAIAPMAMLTGSAYAADWNFYGSARVSTFYSSVDAQVAGTADVDSLAVALQGNARIGANVKVSDELSGRFEYGSSAGNANIRLLYGVWNFGAGTLLVGQDYTPIRMPYSNSVYGTDNAMGGNGELGSPRAGQLKLRFGGFQIAAVAPDTAYAGAVATTSEIKLPQLAAKYVYTGENFTASILGGYATFDINNQTVNSVIVGAGAKGTFGAFTLAGQIHGGSNVGNLTSTSTAGAAAGAAAPVGVVTNGYANVVVVGTTTTIQDTDAIGYSLVGGYTVNDMFGLEAGFGYQETELDIPGTTKDEVNVYYLQAPITMAPGVTIVPEVGVVDYKEAGESKTTYFGAKWQINF